ncbi:MAG: NAD-dependent epimerase/dehydratase family protein [Suipraeoptans sp.]
MSSQNSITQKSVTVTGGCGMIGSTLVKRLVEDEWDVFVVDNLWRGKIEYLNDENGKPVIDLKTRFFKRDLTRIEECEDVIGMTDFVVHLADVVAGIEYVFKNQSEIFRINNQINSNVFHCAGKCGRDKIKGILYAGTVCSFPQSRQSDVNPIPLTEDELYPAMPESAYGWSKLIGQLELGYIEKEAGIPCSVLMFHNVYGAPADFGERSQVIPSLIRKAIEYPQKPFIVWGSGEQGRAFVHVDDVVDALCLALEKGWGHGHIQIGPSNSTSIKEIAETIVSISGKDIDIIFDTSKPEGDKARCANYAKAKEILGWEPRRTLEEGLLNLYKWIEDRV